MRKSLSEADSTARRPFWQTAAMLLLFGVLLVLFSGLGLWQLQRLAWKKELISTVDTRLQAEPIAIPDLADWAGLDVESRVYQRVYLSGSFDHAAEVQSLAVTELGGGYWVMTPLQLEGGGTVIINRGFVPQSLRDSATRLQSLPKGRVVVTGLLRLSEPEGGFLRKNDPGAGRWYSRDIAAIATARQLLGPVAPFFVDASSRQDVMGASGAGVNVESDSGSYAVEPTDDFPRGGLTVVNFRNTHLSYALTWFALAVLSLVGIVLSLKEWRRASSPVAKAP